ncbi:MAG: DUF4272 domain-containing protein [Bacteroidia bacterium]|nr:DUF4272 domain-containing protein [Bacteroidia bacterium]
MDVSDHPPIGKDYTIIHYSAMKPGNIGLLRFLYSHERHTHTIMLNWLKSLNRKNPAPRIQEDSEPTQKVRKPEEVGERILALLAVLGKVFKEKDSTFWAWYDRNSIENILSEEEKAFIHTDKPKKKELINFSWRMEALVSLLWGVKLIEEFPPLNEEIDVYSLEAVLKIINDPLGFMATVSLRSDAELQDKEMDLYNYHWQVRDAQIFGKRMPAELNPSVVYERRYGLSWLVGWGEDWDEVPTDT